MNNIKKSFFFSLFLLLPCMGQAQSSFMIGEDVAIFYPDEFDSLENLPSLAITASLSKTSELPTSWVIAPKYTIIEDKHAVTISVPADADLYGNGEVTGPLLRNNTQTTLWNTDNYGYDKADGERLYQSHPWILGVRSDGTAFGILADQTWKMQFDLGDPITIISEGPAFRVFIIEKDNSAEVLKALAELTGTMELPPLWALGYQQCRFSYFPDTRVMDIADEFRVRKIPCDVIWVDIDYMQGYRVFTFDDTGFSDPKALNEYLHERDFKSVFMIDPGIKKETGYSIYDQGTSGDHWVTDKEGHEYNGKVWPGQCAFPDYTRPETQEWWAGLYPDFMAMDIDGVWNDMNEPSVFDGPDGTMPADNWHRGGGDLPAGSHLRYHNVYGLLMVKASREGILASNPDKRPFVLSRSNFIGGHRYAATWTGDNKSTWEHLKLSIPMSLSMGLSGQPFNGPDIGGFSGDVTTDLLGHWMALGAYYPFSRNHSEKGTADQEPWAFGEKIESASRTAINRRYQLMPYLYTLFQEAAETGMPIMRPTYFADYTDLSLRTEEQAFLLGADLLVIPRWAEDVNLPQGDWKNFELEEDSDEYQAEMKLRPGAILPLSQVVQSTVDYTTDSMTLLVNPDVSFYAYGEVYHDAGDGYDYQSGAFARHAFSASPYGEDSIKVEVLRTDGAMDVDRKYRLGYVENGEVYHGEWKEDVTLYMAIVPEVNVEFRLAKSHVQIDESVAMSIEIQTEAEIEDVRLFEDYQQKINFKNKLFDFNWLGKEPGIYSFRVEVELANGYIIHSEVEELLVGTFGTGEIRRDVWFDISGKKISNLLEDKRYPNAPSVTAMLSQMESPVDIGDDYAQRIYGYVHPPTSGKYRFFIAGDDESSLYLSPNENPGDISQICFVPSYTSKGEWTKYQSQTSSEVELIAGEKYFIQVIHKEGSYGDFFQVAWEGPAVDFQIIPGKFLSPAPPVLSVPEVEVLKIYPNPANDIVKINGIGLANVAQHIRVNDLTGRLIYQADILHQTDLVLDVSGWKSGMYSVRMEVQGQVRHFQLLVKH